jgi:thiosulfate/3-mercaptopyruvate sulfurtransferase
MSVLLSVSELAGELASGRPPLLLDVRWALGDPNGLAHYRNGHLPGARFVDLETELAGPPTAGGGRHPLPDLRALQRTAQGWGLRRGDAVVVYDNTGGVAAARAWWLLRWAGVRSVRLLDGGLGAWLAGGHPLSLETPAPAQPGDVELSPGHLAVLTPDQAAQWAAAGRLLDARAAERYRGEVEPVDAIAGHIPGAINAPTTQNLDATGRLLPPDRLRERFIALGIDATAPVGAYCGSGVTAAHTVLALATVGVPVALYPGSWSGWISDAQRPVAVGDERG